MGKLEEIDDDFIETIPPVPLLSDHAKEKVMLEENTSTA